MTQPISLPVTEPQRDYVRGMQRRLNVPDRKLDRHCLARFGQPLAGLDRAQMSALIDEMKDWLAIPAQLQREAGQRDLPGFV